jgi:glycerol uptake facilitator-like aquaporin
MREINGRRETRLTLPRTNHIAMTLTLKATLRWSVHALARPVAAELLGTMFLLAIVVGSGIMADKLARVELSGGASVIGELVGNNVALALLANGIATGAGLVVLIQAFAPASGAHFNPVVTLVTALRGRLDPSTSSSDRELPGRRLRVFLSALAYIVAQFIGAVLGVWLAHGMFELTMLQTSGTVRTGPAQWLSEFVATFGLLMTILTGDSCWNGGCVGCTSISVNVGLYITSAYWFTSSTSFANPAVTFARAFTSTFAGIRPVDVGPFVIAQVFGAIAGWLVTVWLVMQKTDVKNSPAEKDGTACGSCGVKDEHQSGSACGSCGNRAAVEASGSSSEPPSSSSDVELSVQSDSSS